MTIQLPADVEASIRQKVESGRFGDVGDVVRAAMRLLDEQERQLATLRAKLQEGLEQADRGEWADWTPQLRERIRQSARRRRELGDQPDPDV